MRPEQEQIVILDLLEFLIVAALFVAGAAFLIKLALSDQQWACLSRVGILGDRHRGRGHSGSLWVYRRRRPRTRKAAQ